LRHGIDHLDEIDPVAPSLRLSTAALTLRQISEDGRRARKADRAGEVDEDLGHLVSLARLATSAHAIFYFDIDRRRESAYLRAADGPDSIAHDSVVPLERDPFAFVLDRGQSFYATDFPRLLWNLPYYGREVRIGSLLAVPARRADVVCGVLVADKEETQAFTGNEPTLLAGFAEMAMRAIQQVLESGSREEMGTEFKAVYAVSKNLARVEGAHSLRRLLVRSARDMVSSLVAVAIVSMDESETRYVVEAEAHGWPTEFAGREVGLSERTWAAWMLRSAEEPYLLDALADQKDRMPILTLDEGSPRAESLLMLPLRAGDRNLGALVLTGKAGTFDATALRVLGILTNQTAAALATIRHLDRSRQLAIRDGLTRLYNRRAFDEALGQAVAREDRKNGTLAVLLLDIDHFKKLNDTHGHQAGDEALRHMAVILQRHLRQGDLAARYGGEEFVVILPATDHKGALYLAERVRKAIAKASVVFEGARLSMTVSLGMAVWPRDGRDTETLMAAADQGLYAAKEGGRNRVVAASSLASKTDSGA
jgi:diguanylate cyclase (GGDEF)-like protein